MYVSKLQNGNKWIKYKISDPVYRIMSTYNSKQFYDLKIKYTMWVEVIVFSLIHIQMEKDCIYGGRDKREMTLLEDSGCLGSGWAMVTSPEGRNLRCSKY